MHHNPGWNSPSRSKHAQTMRFDSVPHFKFLVSDHAPGLTIVLSIVIPRIFGSALFIKNW